MKETLLPELTDPEARTAVAEALGALFQRWGIHEVNQAQLLALTSVMDLKGKILEANSVTMERAGHILAIDRALRKRYPYQSMQRDQWIFTTNEKLDHLTPLSVMLKKGLPGIKVIRELVET